MFQPFDKRHSCEERQQRVIQALRSKGRSHYKMTNKYWKYFVIRLQSVRLEILFPDLQAPY